MIVPCKTPKLAPLLRYLNSLSQKMELPLLEQALLESDLSIDDVQDACIFGDKNYHRNKIACSDWYDLLVICWKPGQASAIHDHTASSCGFKILTGVATEQVYERTGNRDDEGEFVRGVSQRSYACGEICLAQDQDIHRISNESASEKLVTLHVYSPPLHMSFYKLDPSLGPVLEPQITPLGRSLAGGRER